MQSLRRTQGEQWDQAQRLFLSAADLPPGEQSRFLDEACGDDTELRAEVESLMRADRGSGQVIASVVETEASLLFDHQFPGDRLGAYRVVRELGRGGMGAVFLAVRDDDQYLKQVAIKVVKRGMDTAEVLERFRYERQILANLDHPYIAHLHDGGTTRDGRPFFVMEYVEGMPIDVYCAERDLDIKARLRLFLHVCEAVAHAHRNLVVHRDLKPANIFVTDGETPKLLDFGVAKLIGGDAGGPAPLATMASLRLFTPEYASPEQVLGLPVTTAADVYSLGAVLYELLTGQRARNLTGATMHEIDRAVCEEVKRPSLTARGLDSDLDNIVLMAMRKEPDRRYRSADQLAADIQRHLRGEPVIARQNSIAYRSRKFLRRNRWEITASALVAASLLTATVVSTAQSRRAEIQRKEAVRERTRAEAESREAVMARQAEEAQREVANQQRDEAQTQRARAEQRVTDLMDLANRTLFDVHSAIESLPGAIAARKKIVETTLAYLEHLEKEVTAENAHDAQEIRVVLSGAYYRIGQIQGDSSTSSLQDFNGARASFQKAESLLAPVYQSRPNDPGLMVRWVEIEDSLADLVYRSGQREEAATAFQKLLPIARRLGQVKPDDLTAAKEEALLHWRLSMALHYADPKRGLEHANREVALIRDLIIRFPSEQSLKQELGVGLAAAASAMVINGELERAAEYYRESIALREHLLQSDPHNTSFQRNLTVAYGNYAALMGIPWSANLGRSAEARAACLKGIAIARAMVAADPQDVTARLGLAGILARFGTIDPGLDDAAESLAALEESVAILEPVQKASPKSFSIVAEMSLAREYLGYRLQSAGKIVEAGSQFRASLAAVEPFINSGNTSATTQALADVEALALLSAATNDGSAALESANKAVKIAEQSSAAGETEPRTGQRARAYFVLASVHARLNDGADVMRVVANALVLWDSIRNQGVLSVHRKAIADARALRSTLETQR